MEKVSLLFMGLAGLLFACGSLATLGKRHPRDAALASFIAVCSILILGVLAFLLLIE